MSAPSPSYSVELRGLSKSFGGIQANRKIDLRVKPGTVHAIVGENGAGKSTAMKMLYGMVRPDAGEILVHGRALRLRSPQDAIRAGIGMVHQHFMLAGPYSVLENIVLGRETAGTAPSLFRPVDRAGARRKLDAISARYGLSADWNARIEDLGVGIQQRIEIIKLLYRDASILILDEPTAVLTPQETVDLFAQLRKLRGEGKSILIITHKLKEVLDLADEVTVFRAGEVVGQREVQGTTAEELASLMIGRKVSLTVSPPPPPKLGEPVLEIRALSLETEEHASKAVLSGVDLEVRSGEIVGIAGVEGNGQSELLALISRPGDFLSQTAREGGGCEGSIRILGRPSVGRGAAVDSDYRIKKRGMGVIPEDRHRDGLLLDRPIIESFLLGQHRGEPFSRAGILSGRALAAGYATAAQEYDIRPRSPEVEARGLSGGNQQKVIIARALSGASGKFLPHLLRRPGCRFSAPRSRRLCIWGKNLPDAPLRRDSPRLVVAAQPTRGVDVGAIEFIHGRILDARNGGAGVLLVSSELDEVLALSDRILVLFEGRIVASFSRGEADESVIGLCMGGGARKAEK